MEKDILSSILGIGCLHCYIRHRRLHAGVTYGDGGNLLSKTTGDTTITYTYGDTGWKDLLTAYNGQTITYDTIGNPLTYRDGMTFTWQNGRQLATLNKSGLSASFTYNLDGIRTSKTVNGVTTEYYLDDGGAILAEDKGGTLVRYLFDENGTRIGMYVNGAAYMYGFNAQGDVVTLRTASGTILAKYAYDAWGKPISVTDANGSAISDASHIANLNSFRYRGYYYDSETGLYSLLSRYYDPTTGRFINADALLGANMGAATYNLFNYCVNNPMKFSDTTGLCPYNGTAADFHRMEQGLPSLDCTCGQSDGNIWDRLLKSLRTLKDSFTLELGLGGGFRGSVSGSVQGVPVEFSGGYKTDAFNLEIGHGDYDYGTKETSGVSATFAEVFTFSQEQTIFHSDKSHNCQLGYRPGDRSGFEQCPESQFNMVAPDAGISIGVEAYFIVGVTAELGWDYNYLYENLVEIWG